MGSNGNCPERDRLRELHRSKIDEWLEELQHSAEPENAGHAEDLKKAIGAAMEDLLEHRRRHGC